MTEAALKQSAINCLIDNFGHVETERFISLILKEPFDYTEWQKTLFADMTVDELSSRAMENRLEKRKRSE